MAMNALENLATVFDRDDNEIFVDPALGERAMRPLRRMLEFNAARRAA
jgi:quinolinate synthase